MSIRANGGYIGPRPAGPSTAAASGVWDLRTQERQKRAGAWPFVDTDPHWSSVSLLLHMDGSGSTFVDSSGTPETITANGNATQSTAQSKFGGKSAYFDGNGDYLTVSNTNSSLDPGSGDFTYEAWLYLAGTQRGTIIGSGSAGNVFSVWIDYNATGAGKLGMWASSNGSGWNLVNADTGGNGVGSTTLSTGVWYHVAYTRSGNTFRLFLNGNVEATVTASGAIAASNSSWEVGRQGTFGYAINGYIDDLRVTKGVARYTAGFTPPTNAFPDG